MLYFLFFILGIIVAQYIFPLLDSLSEVLLTKIEVIKAGFGLQVTERQIAIEKLVNGNEDNEPP